MCSALVKYFLNIKSLVAVDEAESGNRSQLILKRLEMGHLPPKLVQMNPVFHKSLTKLFLQHNSLESLPTDFGELLPNIQILCLDYNNLSNLPQSLEKMKELRKLNISYNQLLGGLPEVVYSLLNLNELWANSIGMTCTDKILPEICCLSKLHTFGLRNNRLDSLPSNFGELKSLVRLSLSGNIFQSIPLSLFHLPTLVHLNLDNNQVEELPPEESFVKAQELRYFRLCSNLITVTQEVCAKLRKLPNLKWCLLDGNLMKDEQGNTSQTFKGFFKPVRGVADAYSSNNSEENCEDKGGNVRMRTMWGENENPASAHVSPTIATTFSNLDANSCYSKSQNMRGRVEDQNDESIKHSSSNNQDHKIRTPAAALPYNEDLKEEVDADEIRMPWTPRRRQSSSTEAKTESDCSQSQINNIPIRIIDIDESSTCQIHLNHDKWEQVNFPRSSARKSSNLSFEACIADDETGGRDDGSTFRSSNTLTIDKVCINGNDMRELNVLPDNKRQTRSKLPTHSLEGRTDDAHSTTSHQTLYHSVPLSHEEEQSRISQPHPTARGLWDRQRGLGQQSWLGEFSNEITRRRDGDDFQIVSHTAVGNFPPPQLQQAQEHELTEIISTWFVRVMGEAADKALNSPTETSDKMSALLSRETTSGVGCHSLFDTKNEEHQQSVENPFLISPISGTRKDAVEFLRSDVDGESKNQQANKRGVERKSSCDENLNLSVQQERAEWNWRCCPMQRVQDWIRSTTTSTSDKMFLESRNHSIQAQVRAAENTEKSEFSAKEETSMDTSKKFRNAVHCSKDQIRREQIHFLKRNSDFGLQLQGVSTTQCASSRRNSSSSTTESHHSVETSTTNQFRASSHNDILAPVSNNYNNTSSRGADLEYSPSAMSLLQNLFDPDDSGDENPFLRDTALELDCSELEYSPRSSDIDDDDFDSIFWEGFIHAEDFNIILKPSI